MAELFIFIFFVLVVFSIWMAVKHGVNTTETVVQQPSENTGKSYKQIIAEQQRKEDLELVRAQAEEAGDTETVQACIDGTYNGGIPLKKPDGTFTHYTSHVYDFNIAGINYRKASEVKRCIGEFWCKLIPEPTNEFDPNAIKIVHEGNIHVGYIPADCTDIVRSLVNLPAFAFGAIVESEDYSDERPRIFYKGLVCIEVKQKQPTNNGQLSKQKL